MLRRLNKHVWLPASTPMHTCPKHPLWRQEGTTNYRHWDFEGQLRNSIQCKNLTPITSNQDLHDGRVMPPQHVAIIMYSNRTIKPVNRNLQWPENKIVISPCEIINSWEKLQRRWQILVSRIRIKSSGLDFVYERGHDPVIQMIDVLGLEARNIKSLYFWTIGPAMIMPQKTMHNSTPNSWGSHLVFTFNSEK